MPVICDACERFICTCDDDLPTRAELTEALHHLATTAARIPTHWTDRKAAIHKQIDKRFDLSFNDSRQRDEMGRYAAALGAE